MLVWKELIVGLHTHKLIVWSLSSSAHGRLCTVSVHTTLTAYSNPANKRITLDELDTHHILECGSARSICPLKESSRPTYPKHNNPFPPNSSICCTLLSAAFKTVYGHCLHDPRRNKDALILRRSLEICHKLSLSALRSTTCLVFFKQGRQERSTVLMKVFCPPASVEYSCRESLCVSYAEESWLMVCAAGSTASTDAGCVTRSSELTTKAAF